ncbi:MAG: hypothetical protein JSW66_05310 [Phycisphaerales bacterium]|nr:MAG: hypothetical protein JSW66_05310 [Phycisphaerales bacterium]
MKNMYRTRGPFDVHGLNIVLALSLLASLASPAWAAQTSTYVFLTSQSNVVKTGGFAGVNETYPIQGQFQLEVDADAGIASFVCVDAFLLSPVSSYPPQILGDVFNMTGLAGVIVNSTTIRFEGMTNNETSVLITLTFTDDTVTLEGRTTPPPNSADFFHFTLDAKAARTDKTETYVFDPNGSTVLKTGGFAGVHMTYSVKGQFRLTVGLCGGDVLFELVDASLIDEKGNVYSQSLDEIFNLTGLNCDQNTLKTFALVGKSADGTESHVRLTLTLTNGSAQLAGGTTPPPNSADLFSYTLDAIAERKYSGGTGDPNDPYQIATAADLIALGETPEDYDKHFILTSDIDLDPNLPGRKVFDRAIIGNYFTGVFDGDGRTILRLTITGEHYLGLFSRVESGAEVKNLELGDIKITGSGSRIGGLAGLSNGSVSDCYISGTVSGGSAVGGLVGSNILGSITTCYSTGTVSGDSTVGGLVGNSEGSVTDSYSTAAVNGSQSGGLVGHNGLAGDYEFFPPPPGHIRYCYATGPVSGEYNVGGLVGTNDLQGGGISNCFSTGMVSGAHSAGGLLGVNLGGSIISSFWDIETSGQSSSAGGTGRTTAEMQTASTFLEAGWDFVGETANGTEDIWSICEGTNYPRLTWQIPAGDVVCPDGITIEDFVFFIEHWLNGNCDSSNDWCDGTDLDRSGAVDIDDLEILLNNWPADSK